MIWVWYALFGIISGVAGGMGMGGGTILIPLLTCFLGISQKLAQGYNLIAFVLMAIIAIIIHIKNKLIKPKQIVWVVIFGCLACVGGALLTTVISNEVLKYIFAGFLILLSVYEVILCFKK